MPVVFEKLTPWEHLQYAPEVNTDKEPELIDLAASVFRTESWMNRVVEEHAYYTDHGDRVEGYNPMDDIPEDLDEFWEEFMFSHSPEQTQLTAAKIRQLKHDREVAAQGGARTVGLNIVAGLGDPVTIASLAFPAWGAARAGIGAVKTAGIVAGAAATEAAITEGMLHHYDPMRTWQESMHVIGGSILLGGAIGGIAGGLSKATQTVLRQAADENLRINAKEGGVEKPLTDVDGDVANVSGDAGSARVVGELDEYQAKFTGGWINRWSPLNRLISSSSAHARALIIKLVSTNYALGGDKKLIGRGMDVETKITAQMGVDSARMETITRVLYKQIQGPRPKFNKFLEDVGRAMVRDDVLDNAPPQVAEAAKLLRKEIIDPITKNFQAMGELPMELETKFAKSYLPRVYDWRAIKKNLPKWNKMIKDHYKAQGFDDAEADEMVSIINDKLRNNPQNHMQQGLVGTTGRIKERGVEIPDEVLQENGFLRTNVQEVLNAYLRSVVPEMHMRIEFGGLEAKQNLDVAKAEFAKREAEIKAQYEKDIADTKLERNASVDELKEQTELTLEMNQQKFALRQQEIINEHKAKLEDAQREYEVVIGPAEKAMRTAINKLRKAHLKGRNKVLEKRLKAADNIRAQYKTKEDALLADERIQRAAVIERSKTEMKDVKRGSTEYHNLRVRRERELGQLRKKHDGEMRKLKAERNAHIKSSDQRYNTTIKAMQSELDEQVAVATREGEAEMAKLGRDKQQEMDTLRRERAVQYNKAAREKQSGDRIIRQNRDNHIARLRKATDKGVRDKRIHRIRTLRAAKRERRAALKKLEGEGNTHTMRREIDQMRDEYDVLIARAKSPAEAKKLDAEKERATKDIEGVRDILLGRMTPLTDDGALLANFPRYLRALSFTANLGMMMISAIADLARPIMQHGVSAWARALPHAMGRMMGFKSMLRQDIEDMGIGLDVIINGRAYAIGDVDTFRGFEHRFTSTFAKFSGMNRWNATMKQLAAVTAQNRFLRDIQNYSDLSPKRKEFLAKFGFDESMAVRIASESHAWESVGASLHANTKNWVDREAAQFFEHALLREANNSIVTPGAADRPLIMNSSEMGKTILQFKSFFMSAWNKTAIPLAQQLSAGDMNAVQGIVAGLTLGAASEYTRAWLSGREDLLENYTTFDWMRAAVDRSGMATVLTEIFNIADKLSMGKLTSAMGMTPGSRYFYHNGMGTMFGPAAGYGQTFFEVGQRMANGEPMTESDLRGFRRLLPYQNIWYARRLINQLEEAVAETMDIKYTRR